MSNQTSAPAICRACQNIDRADGVEDGQLHPVLAKRIRHETAVGRKIRDALSATKDFPGASGNITIDENRNAKKAVVILKIENGKFRYMARINP